MTNVSKSELSEKHFQELLDQMTRLLAKSDQANTALFLSDLLGKEERVMLVKRFAAVLMFTEGNSSYRVWQSLHLSPSTADVIRLDYKRGRYRNITALLKMHKSNYRDLWQVLETILQAGLPPRGKGRWKSALRSLHAK